MVLFSLLLLGCASFATNEAQPSTWLLERQPIIASIYNYDYAGLVTTKNQSTIVTLENPDTIADMITGANVRASKSGGAGALILSTNLSNENSFQICLKTDVVNKLINGANNNQIYQLGFSHPLGSIRFTNKNEISSFTNADLEYKLQKGNTEYLTANAKEIIGNRPIRSISLTNNSQPIISTNENLQLNIPYTASKVDNINQLILYRLEDNGDIVPIVNSLYKK